MRHRLGRRVGVRVGLTYSHNKLALRTRLRNLNLRSKFSIFDSFPDIHVHIYDFFEVCGRFECNNVGVAYFFLGQLIGFDETKTIHFS